MLKMYTNNDGLLVMPITVTYLPDDDRTDRIWSFDDWQSFRKWLQEYVCVFCLEYEFDWHETDKLSLDDIQSSGCMCEIDIEDPDNLIQWDEILFNAESFNSGDH